MRPRLLIPWITLLLSLGGAAAPAAAQLAKPGGSAILFRSDPLADPALLLDGAALERIAWRLDAPAFAGDAPGSLRAVYDSRLPAGRVGWRLPAPFTRHDPFTAFAVLVVESEGFEADPFGFFQISWGLWSAERTGLDRTGSPDDLAGDTFELLEVDYFPNVSPFFGGPFLAATAFGAAHRSDPAFEFLGSFVNFTFGAVQAELPRDVPLLVVLEHRALQGALVVSVHRIEPDGSVLPVPGALAVAPLAGLALPEYELDALGLTLWQDGWEGGDPPSLRASVVYHALGVHAGVPAGPAELLRAPAPVR